MERDGIAHIDFVGQLYRVRLHKLLTFLSV